MLCVALLFSGLVYAPYPDWAMYYSVTAIIAFLIGLSSANLAAKFDDRYSLVVCFAFFVGIVLHSVTIFWIQILEYGNSELAWVQHAAPSFTNIRHYNFSGEIGILLGIGLFFQGPKSIGMKVLIFVGISLLWSLLFWTGARGAILAILVSFAITSIIVPSVFRSFLILTISSAFAGTLMSVFYWLPNDRFGFFNLAARTVEAQTVNQLSSSRALMWREAVEMIQANPLFGYGAGQFGFLTDVDRFRGNLHPHNMVLDAFLTLGVVGSIFLAYLAIKLWFTAVRQIRANHPPHLVAAFWAVNSLIAHSMLSGSLFFVHSRIAFAILIGILVVRRVPTGQS